MKKILLFSFAILALGVSSCKKDRQCKCTVTKTSPNGNTTTDLDQVTIYTESKKSDAKSQCQDYTRTNVNQGGGTSVEKGECKLD